MQHYNPNPKPPLLPRPRQASMYAWIFFGIACAILLATLLQQWSFAIMGQVGAVVSLCLDCGPRSARPHALST